MHKMLLEIPERIGAERTYLRKYRAGDGPWYYAMSQRNRTHLARYEAENVVMSIQSEQDAEVVVRELATAWSARDCFFMGAFSKETDEFVAQVYIGPVNWDVPDTILSDRLAGSCRMAVVISPSCSSHCCGPTLPPPRAALASHCSGKPGPPNRGTTRAIPRCSSALWPPQSPSAYRSS